MTATNSQTAGTTEGRVIGTVISPERLAWAERLRVLGFVHVTGLPVCHPSDTGQHGDAEHLVQAASSQLGCSGNNNGKVVIITQEGEVWIAVANMTTIMVTSNCHHSGAFVPCSNGESIHLHLILERMQDPYSDCHGRYPAIPNPRHW